METKDSHQSDIRSWQWSYQRGQDPWKSSRPLKPNSPLELLMKYIPTKTIVFGENLFF